MDSIQSEAVWKTFLRQIRQTSFSEDHKINIDRSNPRKHTYSFSGILWMVSLGAVESCCETERFFSPIICLKIHPCIYLQDYSDCFEGLSYSILGTSDWFRKHWNFSNFGKAFSSIVPSPLTLHPDPQYPLSSHLLIWFSHRIRKWRNGTWPNWLIEQNKHRSHSS